MHIPIMSKENSIVMTNASTAISAERQHQTTSDAMKKEDIHMCLNSQKTKKNESYVWKQWKDVL